MHQSYNAFKILNWLNPETTNESQHALDSVPIEIQVWHRKVCMQGCTATLYNHV